MASYSVNKRAIAKARELIGAHQYVLESNWGEVQPKDVELAAHRLLQQLDETTT